MSDENLQLYKQFICREGHKSTERGQFKEQMA